MFETTSSKIYLLLAIGLGAISFYMYTHVPDGGHVVSRIGANSQEDHLDFEKIIGHVSAVLGVIVLIKSIFSKK